VFDSGRVGKYLDVGTINCRLEKDDNEERQNLHSSSRIVSKEADRDMEVFSKPSI
jgi:topoisomerase IA-like protein